MSKNRHLAIYPQSQFSAILFTPKYLFWNSQKQMAFEAAISLIIFSSISSPLNIRTCYVVNSMALYGVEVIA